MRGHMRELSLDGHSFVKAFNRLFEEFKLIELNFQTLMLKLQSRALYVYHAISSVLYRSYAHNSYTDYSMKDTAA